MSSLILYTSDDGRSRINLRVDADSVWLSQLEIAELFQTTKQNVSLHASCDHQISLRCTLCGIGCILNQIHYNLLQLARGTQRT